jgi:hypothetical protein
LYGWYFVVICSNLYSEFPRKYHPSKQAANIILVPPPAKDVKTGAQNLQQTSPFLQPKRIRACLRSAVAILAGLLIHSLCNLFINRTKKLFYKNLTISAPFCKIVLKDKINCLTVRTIVSEPNLRSIMFTNKFAI